VLACIAVAIIVGSFAGRSLRLSSLLLVTSIWLLIVYAPLANCIWNVGWLAKIGAWDFAGGAVVHESAGFASLALVVMSSSGGVFPNTKSRALSLQGTEAQVSPLVFVGTAMLWFGWLGFNGSFTYSNRAFAGTAYANTQIAALTAMIVWVVLEKLIPGGSSTAQAACTGALSGLVAITAGAGFMQPYMAILVGFIGSASCFLAHLLTKNIMADNALGTFCVHGVGGFVGVILLGALADPPANPGSVGRSWGQVGLQILAGIFSGLYSFIMTCAIIKCLQLVGVMSIEKQRGQTGAKSDPLGPRSNADSQSESDSESD
jgi:Amt family ammonium transporter